MGFWHSPGCAIDLYRPDLRYKKAPDVGEIGSHLQMELSKYGKIQSPTSLFQNDLNVTEGLVFSAISPDFCSPNLQSGILGTRDRICNRDSSGPDSCTVLCCGRDHNRSVYTIPVTWCQFVWCCCIDCGVGGNQTTTEYIAATRIEPIHRFWKRSFWAVKNPKFGIEKSKLLMHATLFMCWSVILKSHCLQVCLFDSVILTCRY